jgi:hypothetical protein
LESHHHVIIVGPVGVGKTFLAHALRHIACRRGHSVLATTGDKALKSLRQSRLMNAYEAELRKLISVDLLILDDFCLDAMDEQEWLATFADPLRAQSAIDRFVNALQLLNMHEIPFQVAPHPAGWCRLDGNLLTQGPAHPSCNPEPIRDQPEAHVVAICKAEVLGDDVNAEPS